MVRVPGPGLCTPPRPVHPAFRLLGPHSKSLSGLLWVDRQGLPEARHPRLHWQTCMDGRSSGAEYETLSWGVCTPAQWLLTVLGNWLQGKLHGRRVNRSRPRCTCVRAAGASGRQSSTWASIGKNLGYRPGHLPRQPSQPSSSPVPCSAPRSGSGCP